MSPGESAEIAGYTFKFEGVSDYPGPNYTAHRGMFKVTKPGESEVTLHPEKRTYYVQTRPMTEAAIDPGWTRDLYVSLGDAIGDGDWALRLYYKPYIRWIWLGSLFMAFGGLLSITDRRYRAGRKAKKVKIPTDMASTS